MAEIKQFDKKNAILATTLINIEDENDLHLKVIVMQMEMRTKTIRTQIDRPGLGIKTKIYSANNGRVIVDKPLG